MHLPPGPGPNDEDDVPGAPQAEGERTWVHPSEVGMVQRGHHDRRRSSRLAGVLVAGGLGLLGVAVVLGFGWGEDRVASPTPEDVISPSLASLTVVDGTGRRELTGVVVDDEGHVAAAAGSLAGAEQIWVACGGRSPQEATVVATDPATDVAVLRLGAPAGDPAIAGEDPRVGQAVLGVRAGTGEADPLVRPVVVSAAGVDRVAADGTVLRDLFMTEDRGDGPTTTVALTGVGSAPVDGGAVFDERGRFVGLGIGREDGGTVAVPGASVVSVARTLIEDGRVERAWIGVEAADLSRQEALARSLDGGAVVRTVAPGGPAAAAGLQPGDVVVAVDGRAVNGMAALADALGDTPPGRAVTLTYVRGAGRADTAVTVAAAPT